MDKPRFNLGDTVFYVESSCRFEQKVPCEMCFGKRKVTVVLGNGECVASECGYCSPGIDPPSGLSTTWKPDAQIHFGQVTGIRSSGQYEVGGWSVDGPLFATREEAVPLMEAKLKEETERRAAYERDHFVTATKKQIWSVGYHRGRIRDAERSIGWHKMRLCMIEERKQ